MLSNNIGNRKRMIIQILYLQVMQQGTRANFAGEGGGGGGRREEMNKNSFFIISDSFINLFIYCPIFESVSL